MKRQLRISCLAAAVGLGLCVSANAGLISATNSTPGIFDSSSGTRTVAFDGLEAGFETGLIQKVTISINFAKADGESFEPPYPPGTPYYNEIVFRLISPLGTTVELIGANSFNNGSGPGFDGTITFDDSAAQVVNVDPNSLVPGTFRPVQSLSLLNGESALGTFTLFIADTVGADALRFRSFTLNVETVASAVPEPGTLMLGALGAFATLMHQRKRLARS